MVGKLKRGFRYTIRIMDYFKFLSALRPTKLKRNDLEQKWVVVALSTAPDSR